VQVPDALLALSGDRLNAGRERFGESAVYKTAIGTHGGGTWMVDLEEPLNPQVGQRHAFLQKFIDRDETEHHDLRVYVVDGQVIGAMNRYAPEGDWRTNVALGGAVEDMSEHFPSEVAEIARRSTEVVGPRLRRRRRRRRRGRLLRPGGEPDRWVQRDSSRPPASARRPTSPDSPSRRAGGEVDDEEVQRISQYLDDSRPSSMPAKDKVQKSENVSVGYIEEVIVSGTRGSETVLAKSDTGATRTSIDTELAAGIGTGPIKDIVRVKSRASKSGRSRPVVDIVVGVGGTQHTVTASIEDRDHMDYPLLLGRDILKKHYQVDVTRRADEEDVPESEEEEEMLE